MENAVAELSSDTNNGVLVWMFDLLWKPKTERQQSSSRYHAHMPRIANTVVVHYSRVQQWYFVPRSCGAKDTTVIKKKKKQHLLASEIMETLTAGPSNNNAIMNREGHAIAAAHRGVNAGTGGIFSSNAQDASTRSTHTAIVGQLVTRRPGHGSEIPRVAYFDEAALDHLLFHETIVDTAVLQEFAIPKAGDPLFLRNTVFQCQWQPNYCFVEKHVNNYFLHDYTRTPQERGETVESSGLSTSTAIPSGVLLERIRLACNAVAEHIYYTTEKHLRSMTINFKVDQHDRLVLQWCQKVDILEKEKFLGLMAATPMMKNGTVGVSSAVKKTRSKPMMGQRPSSASSTYSSHSKQGGSGKQRLTRSFSTLLLEDHGEHPQDGPGGTDSERDEDDEMELYTGAKEKGGVTRQKQQGAMRQSDAILRRDEREADKKFAMLSPIVFSGTKKAASMSKRCGSAPLTVALGAGRNAEKRTTALRAAAAAYNANNGGPTDSPAENLHSGGVTSPTGIFTPTTTTNHSTRFHEKQPRLGGPHGNQPENKGNHITFVKDKPHTHGVVTGATMNSEAREVISDVWWGNPSQLDNALLKRPDGGPYSMRKTAMHAGRLGLREKYLETMRTAMASQQQQQQKKR